MKKIIFVAFLLLSLNANAQFGFTYHPSDSSYENYGGWSYLPMYIQKDTTPSFDSYYIKYFHHNIHFMKHFYRNDGAPNGLLWLGSDGKLKRSPISELYALTDTRYLQSFTESDPAYKSDSSLYLRKTGAASIYQTKLGYTPYNGTTNPNGYISSFTESDPIYKTDSNLYLRKLGAASLYYNRTQSDGRYTTLAQARAGLSLTTTGTSGAATYNNITGVLNIPSYTPGTVTSVGLTSSDFAISGSPLTASGSITANLNTSGVAAGTYDKVTVTDKGIVTAGVNRANSMQTRAFNTSFRPSTTRDSEVKYTIQISATITLTSGQSGSVSLQISSDNVTFTEVSRFTNTNTGSLTAGTNLTNTNAGQITTYVPPGYYVKLVSSGTATITYIAGQEMLY